MSAQEVLEQEVADLRALLTEAIASERDAPCRLDHNGDCQEHGWFDGECFIPRAIRALESQ